MMMNLQINNSNNNRNGYSAIPSVSDNDEQEGIRIRSTTNYLGVHRRQRSSCKFFLLSIVSLFGTMIILCTLLIIGFGILPFSPSEISVKTLSLHHSYHHASSDETKNLLPMPPGVNLASWLSLEDYFFVGTNGAVEVATYEGDVAAKCLPPLHVNSLTGPKWNSETDLFTNLTKQFGIQYAIRTFHAFRISYLDWDEDLANIASLGIKRVRVSVSWCMTDYDPSKDMLLLNKNLTSNDITTLEERYTCIDPYFAKKGIHVQWPAVPKSLFESFLRACAKYNIKAILDVHTYPGGTSPGTFSGVWPRQPLFWQYDKPEDPNNDIGRKLFTDLLSWIEGLSETDPKAFNGLGGITPMNEPAHLAGLFGPGSVNPDIPSFLPDLPADIAVQFLSELAQSDFKSEKKLVSVPPGPHLRVLKWQSDAIELFRSTTLPKKNIELVVNLHESILVQELVLDDGNDIGGRHPYATALLAAWWRGTTTASERSTWAVLDMHHYHAWEPNCQGTVDGLEGSYTCGDSDATKTVLDRCASWAEIYRNAFDEQLDGKDAKLVSGEFSASTHHSVLHSCIDSTTLRKSYLAQIDNARKANVDLYWWAWKMPYGGTFRPAWSFKHFLYLMKQPGWYQPDETTLACED